MSDYAMKPSRIGRFINLNTEIDIVFISKRRYYAKFLTFNSTIFYSLPRRNFRKGFSLFFVCCQVKSLTKILVTSALL